MSRKAVLARQSATRRLFQSNSQQGATGAIVVDEVSLKAEGLIRFGSPNYTLWGMWVDEPNRLLFAALPNANAIGVADLDTLAQVATIPVGDCPYAVTVDPVRRVGVSSNPGSPTANATATRPALGRSIASPAPACPRPCNCCRRNSC